MKFNLYTEVHSELPENSENFYWSGKQRATPEAKSIILIMQCKA